MLSDEEFRALLELMMVSDPGAFAELLGYEAPEGLLTKESDARGFASWIVAYYEAEPRSL